MKSVLLSISPKWCALISSGKKTIEVRKTRPKLETPFKCYIYCPEGGPILAHSIDEGLYAVNGKVIGEFVCDKIDVLFNTDGNPANYMTKILPSILKNSALSYDEFACYVGSISPRNNVFGWHISDLKIYDEPKELGEFHHCGVNYHFNPAVTKPQQSWCYVEELQ